MSLGGGLRVLVVCTCVSACKCVWEEEGPVCVEWRRFYISVPAIRTVPSRLINILAPLISRCTICFECR